jgi:tricorn protease
MTAKRTRSDVRPALPLAALAVAASLLAADAVAQTPTRLLRFPDVHGERVAFVYAGDLYIASLAGGWRSG